MRAIRSSTRRSNAIGVRRITSASRSSISVRFIRSSADSSASSGVESSSASIWSGAFVLSPGCASSAPVVVGRRNCLNESYRIRNASSISGGFCRMTFAPSSVITNVPRATFSANPAFFKYMHAQPILLLNLVCLPFGSSSSISHCGKLSTPATYSLISLAVCSAPSDNSVRTGFVT